MERLNSTRTRTAGLALGAAMAAALLVSCAGQSSVASSGTAAVAAGEQGDVQIARAEQRVAKSPRDARARTALAQVYLTAGRFDSAATTFEDAISLGDDNPQTALRAALAYAGAGRNEEAMAVLQRVQAQLPGSDFGLAVALAGQPATGVSILTDVVRGGEATPKARQNLAYAYALDGRWREARLIASQDLTGDQLDARLNEWAANAAPTQGRERIASLIGAPLRGDPGQPAMLALNPSTDGTQVAAAEATAPEAAAPTPAPAPVQVAAAGGELPAVQAGESFWGANQPEEASPAPAAAPRPAASVAAAFRNLPKPTFAPAHVAEAPAARRTASQPTRVAGGTTHLVQLGSFRTMDGAKRAWAIFQTKNPKLKDHALRITEAQVNGQRYYRVAAEGFDRGSAESLCSTVRKGGSPCLAYSDRSPLPGAKLASR